MSERFWNGEWTRCRIKPSPSYEQFESGARVLDVKLTQNPRTPQYKTKWPERRDKLVPKRRPQSGWKRTTDNTKFFDAKNMEIPTAGQLPEPVVHRKLWDIYPGGYTIMRGRTPRLPDSGPMSAPGQPFTVPSAGTKLPDKVLPAGQLRPVADERLRNQPRIVSTPRTDDNRRAPQFLADGSEMAVCASKAGTRLVVKIAPPPLEAVLDDVLRDLYGGAQGTMNLVR